MSAEALSCDSTASLAVVNEDLVHTLAYAPFGAASPSLLSHRTGTYSVALTPWRKCAVELIEPYAITAVSIAVHSLNRTVTPEPDKCHSPSFQHVVVRDNLHYVSKL